MVAELRIPADLLPRDGRFGCGPSRIRPEAVEALVRHAPLGTSHRRGPVRALIGRLQEGLRTLFQLPDGYEVVLANGGATAFWDMATYRLIRTRSLHYVFGEFSGKFHRVAAAAPWLEPPVAVEAAPGARPGLRSDDSVDVQALTHNETSTGVVQDIRRVDDALVVVDGTSAAAGVEVDPTQFDAYYFSLQKGLASDGGLVVALLSPAAVERVAELRQRHAPAFLDLATAIEASRAQQTPNTPAIATLFLAAEQVDWLNAQGGLAWAAAQCRAKAEHVYRWAEQRPWARPFVADPAARSPVVATIELEGVSADDLNAVLRANGILDTEGYRKLGGNQIRIGLFPAVEPEDVEALTACIDWVVERLAG